MSAPGVTEGAATGWRPGTGRTRGAGRRWTDERLDHARDLVLAGLGADAIAAEMGVSVQAWYSASATYGIRPQADVDMARLMRANGKALEALAAHHRPGTGELALARPRAAQSRRAPGSIPPRPIPPRAASRRLAPETDTIDLTAMLMGDPAATRRRPPTAAERRESAALVWPGGRGPNAQAGAGG